MAIASRSSLTVGAFTRTCIFLLIFCLAGCAAGSCLSYGHSCWGAHGKRSDRGENALRLVFTKALTADATRNAGESPTDEQWILSRLIGRRPRVRWAQPAKANGFFPRQWDNDETTTNVVDNDLPGDVNGDTGGDAENGRRATNSQHAARAPKTPEIVLVSDDDYVNRRDVKPEALSLFGILRRSAENFN